MTVVGAALRGAVVGAAVVLAVRLVLVVAIGRLNGGPGRLFEGDGPPFLLALFDFLVIVAFLPAAVLGVGIGLAVALRLPLGWLVGLVAPVACWAVLAPLPNTGLVQFGVTAAVYASVAVLAAAWRSR